MIKNNIEQMRLEFDKKIQEAILENALSEPFEDCYFRILKTERQQTDKPDGYKKLICLYKNGLCKETDVNDFRKCLELYPITENIFVYTGNGYIKLPVDISTSKSWGEKNGKISLKYIHNEFIVWVYITITEELMDIFDVRKRDVTSSEISTYTSIHEARRKGYRPMVDVFNFKSKQIVFYGGHNELIDIDEINRIMRILKGEEK